MQISLRVHDKQVKQSMKVLGTAVPRIVNKHLDAAMEKAHKKVTTYPSKRPRQKYKRTFIFRDKTKVVQSKRGTTTGGKAYRRTTLVSDAVQKGRHYSVYVTGNAKGRGQAWMHKGRWKVAAEEVTKASKPLIDKINKDINRELKKVK